MHSVHAEYTSNLDLTINNNALPMAIHPKVMGLTLDPTLTYNTHIHTISAHVHKPLQIIKVLTATGWGKQKEKLMVTYKVVMRPALEYASSIWTPLASSNSINKLQVMQNAALRTATGCTQDTNIQHLHDETLGMIGLPPPPHKLGSREWVDNNNKGHLIQTHIHPLSNYKDTGEEHSSIDNSKHTKHTHTTRAQNTILYSDGTTHIKQHHGKGVQPNGSPCANNHCSTRYEQSVRHSKHTHTNQKTATDQDSRHNH